MNQSRVLSAADIFSKLEIAKIKEVIESCSAVDDVAGAGLLVIKLDPSPATLPHLVLFGALMALLIVAGSNFR